MKTYISTLLLCFILTTTLFSQVRFGPDTRLTDIIVQVESTVLQLPEQRDQEVPAQAEINIPELADYMVQRNVQLILRSFPDADPADTVLVNEFGQTVRILDRTRVFRFRFAAHTDLEKLAEELQGLPGIIFAETIPEYEFDNMEPNDEHFAPRQWNLHHTGQGFQPAVTAGRADVRAPEAWAIYSGSSNVNIGIIDTGVRLTHEDLVSKITGDSHTTPHGTHVAGIAAAITDNEDGIGGMDWNAQIISKDVSGFDPEVVYDKIISALNDNANVLNNSWSGQQSNTLQRRAFAAAYNMNVLSIATTGNTFQQETRYPGGLTSVMAVGSSNHVNERSGFSTYDAHIDLVAPGGWGDNPPSTRDIYSTWSTSNSDYAYNRGTSMAAPHVSGTASLLRGFGQDELSMTLHNDDIRRIIQLSADKVREDLYTYDADGWHEQVGHGRLNTFRALQRLATPYVLNHYTANNGSVHSSTGTFTQTFFDVPGLSNGTYTVKRHDVRETVNISEDLNNAFVWGRGVATTGFSAANPNYGMGYTNIVSSSNTSATLQTYVYEVWNTLGQFVGWYPSTPANVEFAYTVHGLPTEIGGPSEVITFQHNVNVEEGNSLTILSGTVLNLQSDLIVEDGAALVIEPDATINFMDDNVKIEVDGTLSLNGSHFNGRVTINGSGYTGNEINANAGATVKYTDFTSVELNVSGSGKHATIWDNKFLNSDGHGVMLDGLNNVSFRRNYIDNANLFGLYLLNLVDPSVSQNTITGNQRGIYFSNTDVTEFFYKNVVENNSMSGIQLVFGSEAWLVNEDEELARNRYKDNQGNQVYISSNSKAHLSDSFNSGYNQSTVYHSDYPMDPWEYEGDEFIYNDNTSWETNATETFWGTSSAPLSSVIEGDVDVSNHLSSDKTISPSCTDCGSPHAKMAGPQEESKPAERTRKDKMLEIISELEEDAYRRKNDHRLSELYMQMRRDRKDEMGLRDQILATIEEWASRRTTISSEYEDSEEVRRAVETAMLLQVSLAIRSNDYALAKQRNDAYEPYIQLTENRLALVDNQTLIHIRNKDYEAALQTLDEARTVAQSLSLRDKDSWDVMEQYVMKKMGQEVDNPEKNIVEDNRKSEEEKPATFALKAAYPNPFNPSTIIPFELPESSEVRLEVYDVLGRRVTVLTDQRYEAGRYEISWNASTVASGVYIVRMMVNTGQGQHQQFNRQVSLVK